MQVMCLVYCMYSTFIHSNIYRAEWLRRLALKLLAPLVWDSNPMRGSCQLLTEFLLVHSQEQFVPPAVKTDGYI